ncbi:MAG TPA: class I SAM-dependent methyltransferase [Xanthobacteraceae bacterium]
MTGELSSKTREPKDAVREQWNQVARSWSDASVYIRPWLREATQAMLVMAGIRSGSHVLDVAAGAGDQTLDIAERVGPEGYVLATDLSPGILAFAQRRIAEAGFRNVDTRMSDGEALQIGEARFDAVVCRLGLMLFRDPLAGLREMARVLKPGGGVCTMVFSTPANNPCVATLTSIALKHAGLPPRDPYLPGGLLSLGKPELIDDLFRQAGLTQVATTAVAAPFKLPTVKDYLKFSRTSAGPIIQILQQLDVSKREAAWAEIETSLSRFETAAGWEGPNELLLTAARR